MRRDRFQLISNNAGIIERATITLSTVEMPKDWFTDFGYQYESCIFLSNGESDVVARYETLHEAIVGHQRLSEELGVA